MEAMFLNAQRRVISRQDTGPLAAPADFWERTSLILEPTPGAAFAAMVVHGKDRSFWAGNFGSKVTDCKIRILGNPDDLADMLVLGGDESVTVRMGYDTREAAGESD